MLTTLIRVWMITAARRNLRRRITQRLAMKMRMRFWILIADLEIKHIVTSIKVKIPLRSNQLDHQRIMNYNAWISIESMHKITHLWSLLRKYNFFFAIRIRHTDVTLIAQSRQCFSFSCLSLRRRRRRYFADSRRALLARVMAKTLVYECNIYGTIALSKPWLQSCGHQSLFL